MPEPTVLGSDGGEFPISCCSAGLQAMRLKASAKRRPVDFFALSKTGIMVTLFKIRRRVKRKMSGKPRDIPDTLSAFIMRLQLPLSKFFVGGGGGGGGETSIVLLMSEKLDFSLLKSTVSSKTSGEAFPHRSFAIS